MSRFLRAVKTIINEHDPDSPEKISDPVPQAPPRHLATEMESPLPPQHALAQSRDDLPSGRRALNRAKVKREWPDGLPLGRGFASAYLQQPYARAIAKRVKLVEGRPGGGWVERDGKLIEANDYINFKGAALRSMKQRLFKLQTLHRQTLFGIQNG